MAERVRVRRVGSCAALAVLVALAAGACVPALRPPAQGCFAVTADTVRHPHHPAAVWLLGEPHAPEDPSRLMLRLSDGFSPTAPRYWRVGEDGTLVIHVMGGMWGLHFRLRETADGYAGVYEHTTDFGAGSRYGVSLRPIGCGAREWDEGGQRLRPDMTSM